jgi:hypothetical protein
MGQEQSLESLTVKELRAMAMGMEGLTGVSAMKKEDLIIELKKARGIPSVKTREKPILNIIELKKEIAALKKRRDQLLEDEDKASAAHLRKRLSRYKKLTRRLSRLAEKKTA